MAVLLEIRPDASPEEKLRYLRDQLETYLNGLESISRGDIDALIEGVGEIISSSGSGGGGGGGGSSSIISFLDLIDRPMIEGVRLEGNQTYEELNLRGLTNSEIETLLSNTDIDV